MPDYLKFRGAIEMNGVVLAVNQETQQSAIVNVLLHLGLKAAERVARRP